MSSPVFFVILVMRIFSVLHVNSGHTQSSYQHFYVVSAEQEKTQRRIQAAQWNQQTPAAVRASSERRDAKRRSGKISSFSCLFTRKFWRMSWSHKYSPWWWRRRKRRRTDFSKWKLRRCAFRPPGSQHCSVHCGSQRSNGCSAPRSSSQNQPVWPQWVHTTSTLCFMADDFFFLAGLFFTVVSIFYY